MNDSHQLENITADNENSLKTLVRAIRLSQGQFRLILVRCNYEIVRERTLKRLRELSPVEIREIILPDTVTSLYQIKQELGDDLPKALMVFGLDSVTNLSNVLISSNYIREEFSKQFPFPFMLWINELTQQKLLRLAPDFESWATSVEFKLSTDELLALIRQKTEQLFVAESNISLEYCSELKVAWQDLLSRGKQLEPDWEAALEFFWGLDDFANDHLDAALEHYQKSLDFLLQIHYDGVQPYAPTLGLKRQGILLFNIALVYKYKAEKNRAESRQCWQESRQYLEQCLAILEEAQSVDLVAKYISQLGDVLRRLKAWDNLQGVAEKALILHQSNGNQRQLAQDYGFLAEVALEKLDWTEANQLSQQALEILEKVPDFQPYESVLYRFILAKSQQHLGQIQNAVANLEQARNESNPQYDPQLYIDILDQLRTFYFNQSEYLKAFETKQEQQSIEAQYGFRPFIGSGSLRPLKRTINPALGQAAQTRATERITASGRGQDVKELVKKISSNDCKLIVIHGMSGVGKSSLLWAGLVPALKEHPIGDRKALPVILRRVVYSNWVKELGRLLEEELREAGLSEMSLPSSEAIIEQLTKNNQRNLLTVLIFDQFEEFFFVCTDLVERRKFYEFLQICLNIPFAKVILALREDYLHYLLECDRFTNLDVLNHNILDKNIRYSLGDFSPERAKSVILELTENSQFSLQANLVDQLVQDLAGELGEVRPIALQVVGAQLQTDNITTLEQYQQLGANPKEKLVQLSLEEVVKDCGQENERAARLVLYLLTNENNTRPLKTRKDLIADLTLVEFESEIDKLDLVLDVLVGSGLVLEVPDSTDKCYQLVHDYLVSFIRKSQQAEEVEELKQEKAQRLRAEAKLNQVLKQNLRKARLVGVTFFILSIVAGGLGIKVAIGEKDAQIAQIAQISALISSSKALFASDNQEDALIEALKAGGKLKRSFGVEPDSKMQVVGALQQAFYSLIFRERQTLTGHNDGVSIISWSPNGKILASGSGDKTIKLWSRDGNLLQTLKAHNDKVSSISWSPDGKILASGSWDKTIKLWSRDGKPLQTLPGHISGVNSLSWSPDGKILASGSWDKTIKLWSRDGKLLQTFKGHISGVNSISWSPNGKILASGSDDKTIKLWSRDGKLLQTLKGHNDAVISLSWSPDGQTITSGSKDKTIKLWSRNGKPLQTLKGHYNLVSSISWSPDGNTLASGSGDNTIKLWSRDGKLLQTLKGHNIWVNSLSWSPDGKILASGSWDKTIKLWSRDGKPLPTLKGHNDRVNSLSWSPNGKILASGSGDKTLKLWSRDGKPPQTLTGHNNNVSSVSWSPDGNTLASGSEDKTIKLWSRDGKPPQTLTGHNNNVSSISWSPDGNTLASGSWDKTIKLWSRDGKLLQTLKGHNSGVNSISWSPNGKILASGSDDKTIKLWSRDGKLLKTLTGHIFGISSISWSPDGNTLASGSWDNTIKLWSGDGKLLQTWKGHNDAVISISWSPDGNTLASGSKDNTIKLWSRDGKPLPTFKGNYNWVSSLSWSPDGNTLASGGGDKTIILWNLDLDKLTSLGCEWLKYRLSKEPETRQELPECQKK